MNEILCLGIDGKIYGVPSELKVICDEHGLPTGYEEAKLPCDVDFVARSYVHGGNDLNEHPLRKAFFKLWAAREHNIVEKQRPQDVTYDEAYEMARTVLVNCGYTEREAENIVENYWK